MEGPQRQRVEHMSEIDSPKASKWTGGSKRFKTIRNRRFSNMNGPNGMKVHGPNGPGNKLL